MEMEKKNLLTPNEVTFILIGIMLDVSVVGLPNAVTAIAKQDGWISVIIGAIYPLYVALLAIYVSGKFPKDNILILSKRYLGKTLGTTLNFIFLLSFFSYFPSLLSSAATIVRTETIPSLTPLKIYAVLLLLGCYAASKGIKVLGRICTISFFLVIMIMLPSIAVLKQGSYLNVSPILGSGALNILKGSKECIYDYSLLELIFLIYPFINDRTKIKSAVVKTVGITCFIYTFITFITIYYMGTGIISKTIWSFFTVAEGIKTEVLNNFRYIFVTFWIIIATKSVAIFNFVGMSILQDCKKIKNEKIVYVLMSLVIISITMVYYGDMLVKSQIVKYTSTISIVYNLIYITLITLLIGIKKGDAK